MDVCVRLCYMHAVQIYVWHKNAYAGRAKVLIYQ